MNSKYLVSFLSIFLSAIILKAQPLEPDTHFDFHPNYTKGAFAQNGFMLREKEKVYTNTLLVYNTMQWGIADFFTLGATFALAPTDYEWQPILLANAKTGQTFGNYHHVAFSMNMASATPYIATPTLAYTFGTPRYYAGLVWMLDNVFNNRNYLLLQSGFALGKHVSIASEFVLISGSQMFYGGTVYPFNVQDDECFKMLSVMGKISPGKKNKVSLNVGYFMEWGDPIFTLGFSVRLNRRKPDTYKWNNSRK